MARGKRAIEEKGRQMVEHVLKTLPDYFDAVARGEKTFEVRRDDRGFQKGDILVLHRLGRDLFGRPS